MSQSVVEEPAVELRCVLELSALLLRHLLNSGRKGVPFAVHVEGMPKNDIGGLKAIGNAIKAKGLQKLRWYCQMCQKQCRDENGFKVCRQLCSRLLRPPCCVRRFLTHRALCTVSL